MKYLLDQVLPFNIEQEIDWNLADLNIDEILDYWISHIMEIPVLIHTAEKYLHIGRDEGSPAEHLIIRLNINPALGKEKYFITNRTKEVAKEMELEVAPANYGGTGDQNWLESWMQLLILTDTYKKRNRRQDDLVRELTEWSLRQITDIGINWNYDVNLLEKLKTRWKGNDDVDLFSQETTHTTPDTKRRKKR